MNKWIAIKDEHPNYMKDRNVLVYVPTQYGGGISVETVYNDGNWGSCFHKGWNKGEICEVTHWMKLPEPPAK